MNIYEYMYDRAIHIHVYNKQYTLQHVVEVFPNTSDPNRIRRPISDNFVDIHSLLPEISGNYSFTLNLTTILEN